MVFYKGYNASKRVMKFLRGLWHLGLGDVTPNEKNFKRKSISECANEEEKENLRKKFKLFDAELDEEEDNNWQYTDIYDKKNYIV